LDNTEILSTFNQQGFVTFNFLTNRQFEHIKSLIVNKWRTIIVENHPELTAEVKELDISGYHKIASQLDHENLWTKKQRLFSQSEVLALFDFGLISWLRDLFPDLEIVDIEGIGYPEIYWRLVRPGGVDIAPAHRDSWFWTITNKIPENNQHGLAKIWFPVVSIPNENGLGVYPHSTRWNVQPEIEYRHGREKPSLSEQASSLLKSHPSINLPLNPQQCVLFDRKLFHFGIPHTINATRVSVEFAVKSKAFT